MTTERPTTHDGGGALERVIGFSIARRRVVLAVVGAAALFGLSRVPDLPIDAVPDITNVQVQINGEAPGYSPPEVEQQVTFPIETALAGLPGLDHTRSLSRYALSQVTAVFDDDVDVYFARQLVAQRLAEIRAELPPGVDARLGPIATGLGDVSMFVVSADDDARRSDGEPYSPRDLRTLLDWTIAPRLRLLEGVTEVNAIGGDVAELHVVPDPRRLLARGLTLHDVVEALERNNAIVGAGHIAYQGEHLLVRSGGRIRGEDDIRSIAVRSGGDVPVRLADVAEVRAGAKPRYGAASVSGAETVLGTAVMLQGANSREVARLVRDELDRIASSLPEGVSTRLVYDRTVLVERTIRTVATSLVEGAALVIVVLVALLGQWRAALLPALVIPLAMLGAIVAMTAHGVSGSLMSLGALDFGLIVDGAVIVVENCVRRLADERRALGRALSRAERLRVVFDASREVRRATMFGELLIMVVYLPVLTLGGLEGKMFFPMAFTVLVALATAMALSVTFVPAAVAMVVVDRDETREGIFLAAARRLYAPVLSLSLARPAATVAAGALVVAGASLLAGDLGREFAPTLDEGDLLVHAFRPTGTSLEQSAAMQLDVERRLEELPEVGEVFSRTGTGEIATDPMPIHVSDTFVMMRPRSEWPDPRLPRQELEVRVAAAFADLPGQSYELTQPIEMRFNELIAGVRSDVAVKVFGDDLEVLGESASRIARVLARIDGAADVRVEPVAGLPTLAIEPDRKALARYGIDVVDVQELVEIVIGGKKVGTILSGDRRVDLVVRAEDELRSGIEAIRRLPVPVRTADLRHPGEARLEPSASAAHGFVALAQVASVAIVEGPNQISRENGKRRIVVTANVRGRDLGSFVEEAQTRIADEVKLPPSYWTTWGGQFEHLLSASARLAVVVPVCFALILALLVSSFGNLRDALVVFTAVPMALTGGVASLWLREIPLSISAAVGFIALSGVAVLNGLVMLSLIGRLRAEGLSPREAAERGAAQRLRPVLMTALVAALGFVPMALATGTGSEVQRPLATVVVGGIATATLLTLLVLPALSVLAHRGSRTSAGAD